MLGLFNNPFQFIGFFVAFLVAITIHEFSHAWMADRLGDPTSRLMGRLSLNPMAHLDLVGTLMILFAPFGWAKPVQVDPFNFRNPKRDMAITSLAGPASNFILAIVCSGILRLLYGFTLGNSLPATILEAFLQLVVIMNINLGVFNLVPIHPLDGFGVVGGLLSPPYDQQWQELRGYGMIFLILLVFPILGRTAPISQIISPITGFILHLLLPISGVI
jgi:Zn-dependent protease